MRGRGNFKYNVSHYSLSLWFAGRLLDEMEAEHNYVL